LQDGKSGDRAELDRVRSVYEGYAGDAETQRFWSESPAHRFELECKWGRIRDRLRREGLAPRGSRILDLNEQSVRLARIKYR
jgi:hypothetical protein